MLITATLILHVFTPATDIFEACSHVIPENTRRVKSEMISKNKTKQQQKQPRILRRLIGCRKPYLQSRHSVVKHMQNPTDFIFKDSEITAQSVRRNPG